MPVSVLLGPDPVASGSLVVPPCDHGIHHTTGKQIAAPKRCAVLPDKLVAKLTETLKHSGELPIIGVNPSWTAILAVSKDTTCFLRESHEAL